MATPEWGEDFEIPVDITWGTDGNDDNHENVTTIPTPHFKYVIEVEDWYSTKYFELVYNILIDYMTDIENRW